MTHRNHFITNKNGLTLCVEEIMDAARISVICYAGTMNRIFSAQDVDDTVDNAVLKVLRAADSFDPSMSSLKSWVSLIARRCAIDTAQKRWREIAIFEGLYNEYDEEGEVYGCDTDTPLLEEEALAEIDAAIASLGEQQRRIVSLLAEEKDSGEIAEAIGCEVDKVYLKVYRARRALMRRLPHLPRRHQPGRRDSLKENAGATVYV